MQAPPTPSTNPTETTGGNVISLEDVLRRRSPRRPRRPTVGPADDGVSFPCLYIFPVWGQLTDSVGG